ncbi:MAG: DpnD/PcfM family protein [Prevotella sp.]|nr:DpnD/PcfM family protein [Prevotella sp.]
MKYKVEIIETLCRVVEVEASLMSDAEQLVKDQYRKEEIVLDDDDFVDVEFRCIENYE